MPARRRSTQRLWITQLAAAVGVEALLVEADDELDEESDEDELDEEDESEEDDEAELPLELLVLLVDSRLSVR